MQIAIVLFDRFTALDAVGPYQVFSSLPGAEVVFAAGQAGRVSDEERRLHLSAEAALATPPRDRPTPRRRRPHAGRSRTGRSPGH